jgi:hypothetical protein
MFAASFFVALSLSAEVEARGSVPGAKTDRADARPLARACSGNAWPYFEASCLRDARNPFGQARDVRLVSSGGGCKGQGQAGTVGAGRLPADGGLIATGFALRARQ